jgi:uncharacterized membrane protein YczE
MQGNVGRKDAWVRATMAVVFLVIAALFNHIVVLSLGAALLAILCGGTALTHTCPLYTLFGIDTRVHRSHT